MAFRTARSGHLVCPSMRPTLSVLIVTWNSLEELERTIPAVLQELGEGDELIVVDNDSTDGTPEVVRSLAPAATVIEAGCNLGFAAAANRGAGQARGDLLVILNPDAVPQPGFGEAIRKPWLEERGWAAWQALVAEDEGKTINSAGNPLHFIGICWAGYHGRPISEAPPAVEVPTLSGACLAIPAETWNRIGGFAEQYFLYHEDVDLSLRLRIAGGAVGIEPSAVVHHDYEFGAGTRKLRWLERNRWASVIHSYPTSLLALVLPALLATELVLIPASLWGGWGRQKLQAIGDVVTWLPRLLRERRDVQSTRTIDAAELAAWLTADLDSPFIPALARSVPARLLLRTYWRIVRFLLGGTRR